MQLNQLQKAVIASGLKQKLTRKELLEKLIVQRDTAKLALSDQERVFARSTFKRSTMTVSSYGAKFTSVRSNTVSELVKSKFIKQAKKEHISRLALDIYNQINLTMCASNAYMQYAQANLKQALTTEGTIAYNTPLTNFPVRLRINKMDRKRFQCRIPSTKKITIVCLMKDTGVIDKRKTVSSSVPSIIHSLDAAILMETSTKFGKPMSIIHDSFGTHADNLPQLHNCIRSTLVDLYKSDALTTIFTQILPSDIPPIPDFGLKDDFVDIIAESVYCFH